jgi:hypothetical protein
MGQRVINECAMLDGAGGGENGAAWGIDFASLSAIILVGPVLMMTIARQAERDAA